MTVSRMAGDMFCRFGLREVDRPVIAAFTEI